MGGIIIQKMTPNSTSLQKQEFGDGLDFIIVSVKNMQDEFPQYLKKNKNSNVSFIISANHSDNYIEYKNNARVLGILFKPIKANRLLKTLFKKFEPIKKVT